MIGFVKRYDTPARLAAARDHHRWLAALGSEVILPNLVSATTDRLVFTPLAGRIPVPADVPRVAEAIGGLHRAAAPSLVGARLDRSHSTNGLTIPDFIAPRRAKLSNTAHLHRISVTVLERALRDTRTRPAAFYKDCNPRNFLLTTAGVVAVDFDDLTLAPYGYDLAKLIVATAMTHGELPTSEIHAALAVYNHAVGATRCSTNDLTVWAELNWLLTADYLGRNGYTHPWPQCRPWPNPLT